MTQDLDVAPTPSAHLECPDCGEHIPVTINTLVTDDGELVAEFDTVEVWAHSFTHDSR